MMQYAVPTTPVQINDASLQRYLNSITNNTTHSNTTHTPQRMSIQSTAPQQRSITASPVMYSRNDAVNTTLNLNNITRSYTDIPHSRPITQPIQPIYTQSIQTQPSAIMQPAQRAAVPNDSTEHDRAEITFVHDLITKERITRKTEIDQLTQQLYKEREYNIKALNRERIAKETETVQIRSMLTQQYDARIAALKRDFETQLTEQYSTYEQQLDELKNEHRSQCNQLLDDKHECETQIHDLRNELQKYQNMEHQLTEKQHEVVELSEIHVKYSALQQTHDQLNQQLMLLQNDNSVAQSDYNALQQQYNSMLELLQQSKDCIDLRDKQLIELMNSNKTLSHNNDTLAQTLQSQQTQREQMYTVLSNTITDKYKTRLLTQWRLATQHKLKQQQHTSNNDHAIQLIHILRNKTIQSNALTVWRCAYKLRQQAQQTNELHTGINELRQQFAAQGTDLTQQLYAQIAELQQQLHDVQAVTKQRLAEHGDTRPIDVATTKRHSVITSPLVSPKSNIQPATHTATNNENINTINTANTQSTDKTNRQIIKLQAKLQRERSKAIEIATLWEQDRLQRLKQKDQFDMTVQQLQQQINTLNDRYIHSGSRQISDATSHKHSKSHKPHHKHNEHNSVPYTEEMNESPDISDHVNVAGINVHNPVARDQLYLAYVAGQNTAIKNNILLQQTAESTKIQARHDPILQHAMQRLNVQG